MQTFQRFWAILSAGNLQRSISIDRFLFSICMLVAVGESGYAIADGEHNLLLVAARAIVFLYCLVSLVLSYRSEWGRLHAVRLSSLLLIGILLYFCLHNYVHQFAFNYAVLLFLAVPCSAIFFASPRWVLGYVIIVSAGIIIAIWQVESPPVEKSRLMLLLLYVSLGAFGVFGINYRIGWQLQETNERFRVLAEFSSDIIAMHDLSGRTWYVSPSATQQLGYEESDIIGRSAFELIYEADRPHAREVYSRLLMPPQQPVQLEYRVTRKDGSLLWVEAVGTPVRNRMDVVTHVVTATRDISRRKQAEQERESYNAQLLRINRELDQFAYIVSHDLKAPLRGIATLTDFIAEDMGESNIPEDVKRHLELMRERTGRLERLINDILAYSRAGRVQADAELLDMRKALKGVVEFLSLPAGFKVQFEGNFPEIKAPRIYVEQVFGNLINNACQHHDKREGNITLRASEVEGGWEFTVSDDGPGIDPKHHERVFEVFQQLPGHDHPRGTGIGLAVVRKIMDAVGGSVSVENLEPKGCCFRIFWPDVPDQA